MSGNTRLSPGVYRNSSGGMTSSSRSAVKSKGKGLLAPTVTKQPQTITQTNPYGTSTFAIDANGNINQNTTLSDAEQRSLNFQNDLRDFQQSGMRDMLGRTVSTYQNPFDVSGAPQAPDYSTLNANNFNAQRDQVQNDLMDRYKRQLDPMWAQQRQDFEQSLNNRGIPFGSQAYNQALNDFDARKNNAYLDASSQAIQAGGQEQSRMFDMNMQGLNAQQGARTNWLQEQSALRDRPFNEYQSFLGTMNGVNQPQFDGTAALGGLNQGQQGQDLSTYNALKGPSGGGGGGGGRRGGGGGGMAMPMFNIVPDQPMAQPKQPSAWNQLGQGLLGGFVGGLASGFGNSLFGGKGRSIFGGQ